LQRCIEHDAGWNSDERTAILIRGRKRREAVGIGRDDRAMDRCDGCALLSFRIR